MIVLHVHGDVPADALNQVRLIARRFPGPHALRLMVATSQAGASLTLGDEWRYSDEGPCLAALGEFGTVEVIEC